MSASKPNLPRCTRQVCPLPREPHSFGYITHPLPTVGRSESHIYLVWLLSDRHPQDPNFCFGSGTTSWFISFRCRFLHFEFVGCDALNFVNLDGAYASTGRRQARACRVKVVDATHPEAHTRPLHTSWVTTVSAHAHRARGTHPYTPPARPNPPGSTHPGL